MGLFHSSQDHKWQNFHMSSVFSYHAGFKTEIARVGGGSKDIVTKTDK